jgi:hypothetical protein
MGSLSLILKDKLADAPFSHQWCDLFCDISNSPDAVWRIRVPMDLPDTVRQITVAGYAR